MSQTGWIILVIAVVIMVAVLFLMMRKKPAAPAASVAEPSPVSRAADPVAMPEPVALAPVPVPAVEPVPQTEAPVLHEPVPEPAASTPTPSMPGEDNLLRLKGVGPKIAGILKAEGVTSFAQIAAWTDADLAAIDRKLGSFTGRPKRDNWVDQAKFLAAGDLAGFEAKYGKL